MRLIDADELKKRATKLMFRDAPECGEFDAVAVDDIDCMPTIGPESLRPTAEWISVKDRLPAASKLVLVCEAAYCSICIAYRLPESEKFIYVMSDYSLDYATHWMPLPKPPKENADEKHCT